MKIKLLFIGIITTLFLLGCGDNEGQVIELSGIIESTNVNITAKVSGELRKVNFDEGSKVAKNDTLAELDRENLSIQRQQLLAGVALAEAQYNLAVSGYRKEDIKSSEENMKAAKSNYELAEYDKNSMESLYKSGSISEKQWKDVLTKYNTMQAQFKSAEENYSKMKHGNRSEDVASAKAKFDQSKAQLEMIEKQLRDSYIVSPISGIVTHKVYEIGELVNTGSSVFTISN